MSNISGQLIKDSYNYVLQSDLISGIVYRIGGSVAENPKFISGLTVNASFTYSDGSEFPGYVLTCDAAGNAVWGPVSGATSGVVVTGGTFDYSAGTLQLRFSNGADVFIPGLQDIYITGGTVSGTSIVFSYNDNNTFQVTGITPYSLFSSYTASTQVSINNKLDISGFTAYSATTQPLILNAVTGGTYSNGTLNLINNSGATIPITGFTTGSNFTGGTVSGATNFINGLSANTISATTYLNLPTDVFVTGGTYSAGTTTFTNNTGGTFSVTGFSTTFPFTGGTVSGATNFTNGLTANTISATTYYNLPIDVFVTGGTYTSGNAIFTNNTGGTFTVTGFAVGGGGGQTFYLNISQSKNGNRYLSTTASTAVEQSTGVTISAGGTSTIASFQSDVLNTTLIPGGIWSFYLHSYKSDNNASFNIFVEVYKRTSGGTETLLFTTEPAAVTSNSPNPSMQLSDVYFSGSPILVSDSIVARVRATNTSNQSHVITLFSEGSQHYSYAVSTLPTQQGLTCDTLSGCSVIQNIQTDISNKFDKSGGTISGNVLVQSGLTANTISATTYQNLPVSGLTAGQNINISGTSGNFTISFTGTTGSNFTGGTVSGATIFTNGLTANTISATTYSGDGSGLTNVQNIYNSDGTILTDRYVNISASTLWFSGLTKGFQVRISDFGTKPGFIFTSDSLGSPSFSLYETGDILIEGPTEFANTAQFDSTVSMINLSPDITSPYLLGLNNSSEVTYFDSGLLLNSITGGSYSDTTLYLITNSGNTIEISGFTKSGGTTGFSGGTVTGATNFTGGLTATTISATTYQNLPTDVRVTGATYSNNTFTYRNNTGGTFNVLFNTVTGLTVNGNLLVNSTITPNTEAIKSISQNTTTSTALYGIAGQGTNAYGVYCDVSALDGAYTITNGIGGYFEVGGQFGNGTPTNSYSLQLKDGTEGVGKVLTSITSDGKANWSNTLNVSAVTATTISATTYQNFPGRTGSCGVTFDGQGGVISNGKTAYAQIPYNGTLTSWTLVSDVSGSCTITVFKDTYANYPPLSPSDNIYSVQPSLSSANRNQNLTPTYIGSQATVTAGDYMGFTISGVTSITWANLTIQITKT